MCAKRKCLLCLRATRFYNGAEVSMVVSMLSRLPSMVFVVMIDVSETYTFKELLAGAHRNLLFQMPRRALAGTPANHLVRTSLSRRRTICRAGARRSHGSLEQCQDLS